MQQHIGNLVLITAKQGEEILLLHKPPETEADKLRPRKKVGCNCWGGAGGAVESFDLSIVHSAQRETLQETGLDFSLANFSKVGILEGFFEKEAVIPKWIVHIFLVRALPDMYSLVRFNPNEHDDIRWFATNNLPWENMIESDREWLPLILQGKELSIRVVFDGADSKLFSCRMDEARFS